MAAVARPLSETCPEVLEGSERGGGSRGEVSLPVAIEDVGGYVSGTPFDMKRRRL